MVQINELYPKLEAKSIKSKTWLDEIAKGYSDLDYSLFQNALDLLEELISADELYLSLEITTTLFDLKMDNQSALAGLLLYSFRTGAISNNKVLKKFGREVQDLLQGVIRMDAIRGIQDKIELADGQLNTEIKADQLRKMFIAMIKDPRVVVIRLAEHLSELKSLGKVDKLQQQILAKETKLIYAPLANRLGIGQIKWLLEDYAFRYLESETYKSIAKLLDEKRIDRDIYIRNIISQLKEKLSEQGINNEVTGRVKHIYSIWRKMQRKNLEFDELYDIRAVRILTNSVADCYAALGLVHGLWHHIPKEFDDYIAMPKDNGYQSLHTAVVGSGGKIIEVQIRTKEMHNDSELGVAAHWRYKEGVHHDKSFETKIAWLRQLIAWQDEVSSASDMLEELKTDITEERVYILTPKGDVFDLPEGATPLDLAYYIHTEVGNKCIGAKVNGKMVSLVYNLKTGEQVELLTRGNSQPSRDWLNPNFNFIKTPRARAKVQSWFRKKDFSRNVIDGKEILERELQRLGVNHLNLEDVYTKLNFKSEDDVLAGLARGDVKLNQILSAANIQPVNKSPLPDRIPVVSSEYKQAKAKSSSKGINISGIDNLLTKLAGCCKPLPGNHIIGYISQGRGITIHSDDCINIEHIKTKHPERLIEVDWGDNAMNMSYASDIYLVSRDRQDFLRDVTGLLSAEKINILNLKTDTDKTGMIHTYITLEINSTEDLSKVLNSLRALPNVIKASKINSTL